MTCARHHWKASAIVFRHLFHQLFHVDFVDFYELFALPTKIVYVASVYVEPEGVYVQVVWFQPFSEKTVAGDVLQLL